jgi:hypothetical protein
MTKQRPSVPTPKWPTLVGFTVALCLVAGTSLGGPREQAKRMHDRLAGVPPPAAVLDQMQTLIAANNAMDAAYLALDNSAFYDVTLKNFVTPWTNRDQTVFAPLNDYTATVIGMVRDEVPFTEVLSADIVYVGSAGLGLPPYSPSNNDHYEALENQHVDLKANLVRSTQSAVSGIAAGATAGVMTTRAASKAFFIDGTNRAMFRFTLLNHLCADLEQVKDTTRPADRIRQDVSRSPGGDSRIFLNTCVGCHSGMDPMAQAFAYYNFAHDVDNDPEGTQGQLVYNDAGMVDAQTGSRVQAKYLINAENFKYGYVTPDDRWDNYWRSGPNSLLGWDTNSQGLPGSGSGAKSLGQELANSEAFARCQVEKVFRAVCLRSPVDGDDRNQIATLTTAFKASQYNLKQTFAAAAVYCKGD